MPRILKADLLAENERLRMQLAEYESKRDRSRSPRRATERAAKTRRVLDLVCQFERDPVIHEQQATIARQQQEIQDLKNGNGRYGDVLLALVTQNYPTLLDDFMRRKFAEETRSVADVIRKLQRNASLANDLVTWGRSYWEEGL